jgi:hypothetical protein
VLTGVSSKDITINPATAHRHPSVPTVAPSAAIDRPASGNPSNLAPAAAPAPSAVAASAQAPPASRRRPRPPSRSIRVGALYRRSIRAGALNRSIRADALGIPPAPSAIAASAPAALSQHPRRRPRQPQHPRWRPRPSQHPRRRPWQPQHPPGAGAPSSVMQIVVYRGVDAVCPVSLVPNHPKPASIVLSWFKSVYYSESVINRRSGLVRVGLLVLPV